MGKIDFKGTDNRGKVDTVVAGKLGIRVEDFENCRKDRVIGKRKSARGGVECLIYCLLGHWAGSTNPALRYNHTSPLALDQCTSYYFLSST